jgi:hypothetical protein
MGTKKAKMRTADSRLQELPDVTQGRLKYSESAALPQIQRVGAVEGLHLLSNAYH